MDVQTVRGIKWVEVKWMKFLEILHHTKKIHVRVSDNRGEVQPDVTD